MDTLTNPGMSPADTTTRTEPAAVNTAGTTENRASKLDAVLEECRQFPEQFHSLHLATCNLQGEPEASYAVYLAEAGDYYVYTSELAVHTANLASSGRCSVMFIENETEAQHLFARRRLTLQCSATECPRDSAAFSVLMDKFINRFGNFMEVLRTLTDFHLYRLHPLRGSYVGGFAKAYSLSGEQLAEIRHRTDKHRSTDASVAAALSAATSV